MEIERLTMKGTKKAPYQAPGMGDLDLCLERAILAASIYTPEGAGSNEGFDMMGSYVVTD